MPSHPHDDGAVERRVGLPVAAAVEAMSAVITSSLVKREGHDYERPGSDQAPIRSLPSRPASARHRCPGRSTCERKDTQRVGHNKGQTARDNSTEDPLHELIPTEASS